MNGWTGKLLRANLSTRVCTVESSEKYFDYIGGKGMATRIHYDEVPAGVKPFDPESKVVMAIGPNSGSSAPCSGRTTLSFLSTFTKGNAITDAHIGGDIATQMKACGYDAIIIEGVSETPVYLCVKDGEAVVEDAAALWGLTTTETTAALCDKEGPGTTVVSIGKAGENMINLSCVISGVAHCAGGGVGAIFGSKKLKAVCLYGTGATTMADAKRVMDLNNYVMSDLMGSNNNHVVPNTPQSFSQYDSPNSRWTGHPGLTWGAAPGGPIDTGESAPGQPTLMGYRCQKSVFDHGMIAEKYTTKMVGCASCPVRCYGAVNLPQLKQFGRNTTHANTCVANNPYGGIMKAFKDFEEEGDGKLTASVYSAILADDLGLWDNYGELRATLNYFMDKGYMEKILTPEEYAEIDWTKRETGDITFISDILTRVVDKNHSLSTLAQGAYFVDKQYHDIVGDDYLNSAAMTLWGLIGAKRHHGNECAAQVGMLTNIVYNRDGMCHTIVNITGSGLPYHLQRNIIEERFGKGALDKPKNYTPMNESKAKFAKFGVVKQALHDSFTLCNWVWPMTFSPRKERGYKGDLSVESQYYSAITGKEVTEEELDFMAERSIQLSRAMTVKTYGSRDMRNEHDVIPEYAYNSEPDVPVFTEGTVKMEKEDWQLALSLFYKEFGWDENGAPTRETLEKFGLKDVADDLEASGLL